MNQQENLDEIQISRDVHFVIASKDNKPKCRSAKVIENWPDSGRPGLCNLAVFPDGTNDDAYGTDKHSHLYDRNQYRSSEANLPLMLRWHQNVMPNHAVKAIGSWHWPRACAHMKDPAEPFTDIRTKIVYYHTHAEDVVDVNNCFACHYQYSPQTS